MTSILLALFASAIHGDGDAPGPSWYVIEVPIDNYTLKRSSGARAMMDAEGPASRLVGVIPHHAGRVWEIHPLAVRTGDQVEQRTTANHIQPLRVVSQLSVAR